MRSHLFFFSDELHPEMEEGDQDDGDSDIDDASIVDTEHDGKSGRDSEEKEDEDVGCGEADCSLGLMGKC